MQQAYVELNGVRTKVSTWGRWIEETAPEREIIVLIPGNPGVVEFYDIFAKTLYETLEIPVWCVGHAGHNFSSTSATKLPGLKEHSDKYGLKGQIKHKIDFFEKYVPANARVYLVGHSIGTYMILEILEHASVKDKVVDVQLLFPTIENMATTDNGRFMNGIMKHFVTILCFLSIIFTLLPRFIQLFLLYIYTLFSRFSLEDQQESVLALIHPKILRRVFYMAYDEMNLVKERNDAVIRRNINKLSFLYGVNDGWAPASYCDRMKVDIPGVDAKVSQYCHAFVMEQSVEVAQIVIKHIKSKQ